MPRKPRVKPEPITVFVPVKRRAVRFPAIWSSEMRIAVVQAHEPTEPVVLPKSRRHTVRLLPAWQSSWQLPEATDVSEARRATRLPQRWSEIIRASTVEPILVERHRLQPDIIKECDMNTKRIVEAILFAANRPMTIRQIQETFPELEQPDTLSVQMALDDIARDYADRPIGLRQLASGYRFQVREGLSPYVTRLFEEKPARYSRALLETLAIIAYRQPVTRGEIEDIRGVSVSSSIIQTLLEREWIRVIAHKEVPGRPALFGTTKQFLDYFNLTTLSELPTLEEIVNFDFGNSLQPQPEQDHSERPQTAEIEQPVSPAGQTDPENAVSETEFDAQTEAGLGAENLTLH
ncbi:SMC-Scp complex subunit ScpB [Methylomonas sp. 11b]|uniref:SMC-Scp complex subunit ScpB n=1 Tax=Methylomonas sp. 11b TaxID=1168169 RepID=UPI00047B5927